MLEGGTYTQLAIPGSGQCAPIRYRYAVVLQVSVSDTFIGYPGI